MSTSYNAGVFFGACFHKRTAIGERLDEYVVRHGGTPARTEDPSVEICMVGDHSVGDLWLTVQAKGSARSYGRDAGECPEPRLLREDRAWRAAVEGFVAKIGGTAEVGWHFQGSAS